MPALLTRICSLPRPITQSRTIEWQSSGFETSPTIEMALPPDLLISETVSSNLSLRRPPTATDAPCLAKQRAIPRPIPVPPPEIKATQSLSIPGTLAMDFPKRFGVLVYTSLPVRGERHMYE